GDVACDFAVLGAGYTGLFAALRLAQSGADVVVIDAKGPGWGASGRNGGLVSVGGSKVSDDHIERRYGTTDAKTYFAAERAAVDLVEETIEHHGLEIDRHSKGYSFAAHRPSAIAEVKDYGEQYKRRYGLAAEFLDKAAMIEQGLNSPDFHAAVHAPIGFALNPMKFALQMTDVVRKAGVRIFHDSPITKIQAENGYNLVSKRGVVKARKLIVATNGYSSDDLPKPLAGRYLPVQSNILVSRPLSEAEIAEQGWHSEQMVVDTRNLLHYFRLLPDRRMMLGVRGSVYVTKSAMETTRQKARADFERMFPAWQHVETPYFWSGLICMTRRLTPFAGALPGMDGAHAALAYHGNGVSMAPYCGTLVADLALGKETLPHADLMKKPMRRFELGPWRRFSLPPAFAWYAFRDNTGL
ncbi:FAD-binding oxidoreductase, partial [uncultured Cohaesibacter sp.]|uniref:NAD(P)/FAD-dependent oxidoreductase n=1 Tax=uncultured Cohaesibacter sp. TaxID=1002546 RepID=UPI0029C82F04